MKCFLISTFICCGVISLVAQDFNLRHIKTVSENFPHLITTVQVYDTGDEPVTTLKDQNFFSYVDGKNCDSTKAQTYNESGLGFSIMLALDLSGSMKGTPLKTMQNAILKFIDDMRIVDELGLMGYADDAFLISDFSNDKSFLKSKVNSLTTSGSQTALYYGAYTSISKLKENKEQTGKILLLIGDGKNESLSSSYSEDDVINLAKEEGIPVFSIGYSTIDKSYLQSFERISEKTGGKFYNSPKDEDLTRQYEKLYRQILNIYLISYIVVGIPGDGSEHISVITVRLNNISKTVSNKFISPAGISSLESGDNIWKKSLSQWYYFAGAGLILLLVSGFLFFYSANKKKKAEEARKKSELIEAEREKNLEIEKKAEDAINSQNGYKTSPRQDSDGEKSLKINSLDQEKTIILKPGAQGATLRLEILVGSNQGKKFDITASGASIGRKDNNNIVLKEETISGNHAKIIFVAGQFYVEDLNSSNGTFINGKQIRQSLVNHGDVFKFGKSEGNISIF